MDWQVGDAELLEVFQHRRADLGADGVVQYRTL